MNIRLQIFDYIQFYGIEYLHNALHDISKTYGRCESGKDWEICSPSHHHMVHQFHLDNIEIVFIYYE